MSYTPPQGQPAGYGQPQFSNQAPQYPPPGSHGYGTGQFQPPMPPAPPKRRTGLVILIVGALVLVAGGVGAYFLSRGDETGDASAGGDGQASASAEPEAAESSAAPLPCDLNYPDLGTSTPAPSETWSPIRFDTADGNGGVSDAPVGCLVMHDEDNMSYIEAGAWPEASFYDPTRLGYSAAFVATAWAEGEQIGGADAVEKVVGTPEAGEMDIDGHAAGWCEVRVTWQPASGEPETHEDIAVLVVDIDGSSAFIALASIPAVGEDLYEEATVALLSTTFAE
ncbi:hypothetical protein O1R50_22670 [Glycomyces luteolus]|uniref:Uncharacterized protein n=1 Tax=Glycomyces luteolus TaxID=2670330 RepID=A0A9X3PEB6_9ACTN|nr:hypothetical protein [Glycomyces luteolus]MDA1362446.1 hypothetical protein [Glycomyces luteolus]